MRAGGRSRDFTRDVPVVGISGEVCGVVFVLFG